MKVLRVVDVPRDQLGGVALATRASSDALRARGHDVEEWFRPEIAPSRLTGKTRQLLAPVCVAWRLVRHRRRVDVVELHEPLAWASALVLRRTPVVVLSHGLEERLLATLVAEGVEQPGRLRRLWWAVSLVLPNRVAMAAAAHVLVLNQADAEHVRHKVPRATVSTYRNGGAGEHRYGKAGRSAGRDGVLRVLFLGSWIPRKGTEVVAQVAARCADSPTIRITAAGDGAPDPGLPGLVWRGSYTRDEHAQVLAAHDVLLLPTLFEGMPLAVVEAIDAGLAVVASAVGGVVDVIGDGGDGEAAGVLCAPGDVDAFERALRQLAADPALLRSLQTRALDRAKLFTWAITAEDLERAYAAAVAPSTTREKVL